MNCVSISVSLTIITKGLDLSEARLGFRLGSHRKTNKKKSLSINGSQLPLLVLLESKIMKEEEEELTMDSL